MTRPQRIPRPGGFYYITQHGKAKMVIYQDEHDYRAFVDILQVSLSTYSVVLHGFVLLKNHFHLIVETPLANLSDFMRHLNISYASAFNRRHKRRGHLYGGRFKSVLLEADHCLGRVSRYLHLNPIQTGAVKRRARAFRLARLQEWRWSSLPGYAGCYPRYHFVRHQTTLAPHGGDTPEGRKRYLARLAAQLESGYAMKDEIVGQSVLGSGAFIESLVRDNAMAGTGGCAADNRRLHQYVTREQIIAELTRCLRCARDELLRGPGDLRAIAMDMLYRYGGLTNPAIGELMGIDYTSVSLGRRRIRERRRLDPQLNARMTLVEKRLSRSHPGPQSTAPAAASPPPEAD